MVKIGIRNIKQAMKNRPLIFNQKILYLISTWFQNCKFWIQISKIYAFMNPTNTWTCTLLATLRTYSPQIFNMSCMFKKDINFTFTVLLNTKSIASLLMLNYTLCTDSSQFIANSSFHPSEILRQLPFFFKQTIHRLIKPSFLRIGISKILLSL